MAGYQLLVRGGLEALDKHVYRGGGCPWLNE